MALVEQKYSSQFMQHLYDTSYFLEFDKQNLANTLYQKASEHNPNIAELADKAIQLDSKLGHSAYGSSKKAKDAIEAFKLQMEKGEVPVPANLNAHGVTIEEEYKRLGGVKLELERTQAELDKAFQSFETHFFATPGGAKFQEYITAASKKDFTAFLKDHPRPVAAQPPSESSPKPDGAAGKAETTAMREAGEGAERSWGSKLFRNAEGKIHGGKAAAWVAGAAAVGTGVYALTHKEKEDQRQAQPSSTQNIR